MTQLKSSSPPASPLPVENQNESISLIVSKEKPDGVNGGGLPDAVYLSKSSTVRPPSPDLHAPASAELDFQAMRCDWHDSRLQELCCFSEYLQDRATLESHYQMDLKKLLDKYKQKSSVFDKNPSSLAWGNVFKAVQEKIRYASFIKDYHKKDLVPRLHREYEYEMNFIEEMAHDVKYGFKELSKQKADMLHAKKDYAQSKNIPGPSDCMEATELQYRYHIGAFERSRLRQVKLLTAAFKRFSELEERRLLFIFAAASKSIEYELNSMQRCRVDIENLVGTAFPSATFIKHEFVSKIVDAWKNMYSLPRDMPFTSKSSGDIYPFLTFGVDLMDHLSISKRQIPHILEKLVAEAGSRKATVLQIYAPSEASSDLESWDNLRQSLIKYVQQYEKDSKSFDWTAVPSSTIGSLIRYYLSCLPEPLIPRILYEPLRQIASHPGEVFRQNAVESLLVHSLPSEYLRTLAFVLGHLVFLADDDPNTINRLVQLFSPILFRHINCGIDPQASYATTFPLIITSDLMRFYYPLFMESSKMLKKLDSSH